jgi:hypothetical protein
MKTTAPRKTNHLVIHTTSHYWKVVVTPNTGKPIVAMFDNRYGVGRMGNTPSWFIKVLRELQDLNKYPHIHEVMDRLARVVQNTCINNSREGKRPWADVELDLRDIALLARDGVDAHEESLANTYRVIPADDELLREAKKENSGFARGLGDMTPIENLCDGCMIEPCWC